MFKITFFIFFILLLYACTDLFSTRGDEVEEPDPNSSSLPPGLETDTVLRNFSLAIQKRNIEDYKKIFSNPDPEDNVSPPFLFKGDGIFNSQIIDGEWDYQDETNFAEDLFSKEDIKLIQFTYVDSIPRPTPLNETFEETDFFRYKLLVDFYDSPPKIFRGQAQFKLFHSTTNVELWYIYEWSDESDGNDSTFSLLKLEGLL